MSADETNNQQYSAGNTSQSSSGIQPIDAPPTYIPYSGLTPSPSYSVMIDSANPLQRQGPPPPPQPPPPNHPNTTLHYPQPPQQQSSPSLPSSSYRHSTTVSTRDQPSPENSSANPFSPVFVAEQQRISQMYGHSMPTNYGSVSFAPFYDEDDGEDDGENRSARERLPSYKVFSTQSCHLNRDGQIVAVGPSSNHHHNGRRHRFPPGHRSASPRNAGAAQSVVYVPHIGMPSVPNGLALPICPASRSTYHEFVDEYTCPGLTCAVCFFPMGLLCCYFTRERRCFHCGYRLETNR